MTGESYRNWWLERNVQGYVMARETGGQRRELPFASFDDAYRGIDIVINRDYQNKITPDDQTAGGLL